jgi:hypothetical protein
MRENEREREKMRENGGERKKKCKKEKEKKGHARKIKWHVTHGFIRRIV